MSNGKERAISVIALILLLIMLVFVVGRYIVFPERPEKLEAPTSSIVREPDASPSASPALSISEKEPQEPAQREPLLAQKVETEVELVSPFGAGSEAIRSFLTEQPDIPGLLAFLFDLAGEARIPPESISRGEGDVLRGSIVIAGSSLPSTFEITTMKRGELRDFDYQVVLFNLSLPSKRL